MRRKRKCSGGWEVDGVDTRYVQHRKDKTGTRTYWIRPGHKVARLSKGTWPEQATQLNKMADAGTTARIEGTIGAIVQDYRESEWFGRRSVETRRVYEGFMREIEQRFGDLPITALTTRTVAVYVRGQRSAHMQKLAAAVMANIATAARQAGFAIGKPTADLRLASPKPREAMWTLADFDAFLEACDGHELGHAMKVVAALALYTGQRPADVLKMRRSDIEAGSIRVVQQKTGRKVWVPIHKRLLPYLEGDTLTLVADIHGRPIKRHAYNFAQREIRAKAKLSHLQMRDFRRTAATMLRDAGAAQEDIAAVTGHTPGEQSVLEKTYIQRTPTQARRAIDAWERSADQESNALDKKRG